MDLSALGLTQSVGHFDGLLLAVEPGSCVARFLGGGPEDVVVLVQHPRGKLLLLTLCLLDTQNVWGLLLNVTHLVLLYK